MEIAGHVSRQILSRYTHIRTEAKRNALEEVERKRADARQHTNQEGQNRRGAAHASITASRLQ